MDFGFQVSDFGFWLRILGFGFLGFGVFGFQIPNAIDKLKIGALQRANFKLVNCLNDWVRVDARGSGGRSPPAKPAGLGGGAPSSHRSSDLSKFIFGRFGALFYSLAL